MLAENENDMIRIGIKVSVVWWLAHGGLEITAHTFGFVKDPAIDHFIILKGVALVFIEAKVKVKCFEIGGAFLGETGVESLHESLNVLLFSKSCSNQVRGHPFFWVKKELGGTMRCKQLQGIFA